MGHLEKIYPYTPLLVQNVGISLYGLAWRRHRLGGGFKQYVAEFRQRDRWPDHLMRDYVQTQLRQVLCRAYEQVPYYRRAWRQAGLTQADLGHFRLEDLSKLPVTPKQELRAEPTLFLDEQVAAREKLFRYYSSGSTGTPITAICTAEDHRRFIAAREVRSLGWAGSSLMHSRAMIGGRQVVPKGISDPPFHRYNWAERQVYFSAYHIAPEHIEDYIRAFNQYRPALLTGYANSYYLLARMMSDRGVQLDYTPEAAVLCSEKLTPAMKSVIATAFRTRAYEEYGAVENCVLATECEAGSLHVSPDFGVVEIVDEHGQPTLPGETGSILCTSLLNHAQPLIRYEIGDLGVWSDQKCSCGRDHLPILQEIVGRLEDVVIGPDGREMVRFHWIYIDLPNIIEGQLVQEDLDQFTLRLVTRDGFGAEEESTIRRRFLERLGPVSVRFERVRSIPRTERGKFRAVISKIPERQRHTSFPSLNLASN